MIIFKCGDKMILTIKNNKIKTKICTKKIDRFKLLKFKLTNIEEALCIPKKRKISTYLFCQRVDIIFTDDTFKVIKIKRSVPSEKIIWKNKLVYYTFILKEHDANNININDILNIKLEKKEQTILEDYNNKYKRLEKYQKKKNKILTKKKSKK